MAPLVVASCAVNIRIGNMVAGVSKAHRRLFLGFVFDHFPFLPTSPLKDRERRACVTPFGNLLRCVRTQLLEVYQTHMFTNLRQNAT